MMMGGGPPVRVFGGYRAPGRNGRAERERARSRVGLTGEIAPEVTLGPPPEPGGGWNPRQLWQNTRATWSGFRRVLALVWEAQPGLTIAMAALSVLQGGLPALRVWLAKLLIDA